MRESDTRKQIDAYVKGRLNEAEIDALWIELAKNPDLLNILEIEAGIKKILEEQNPLNKTKPVIHKLPRWTWHAAAAAAILLVAVLQIFRVETPTELQQFVVANIDAAQLETADALRNDRTGFSPADSILNLGFNAFISGEDARALELFDEIIQKFDEEPYLSKAYLNKGIILYNSGLFENAVSVFEKAASHSADKKIIAEKAWWYLGNSFINLNKLEDAHSAVYKTYQLNGVFRNSAFRLLVKLNYELGYNDYEADFDIEALD